MITSAQKRALKKKQLEGRKDTPKMPEPESLSAPAGIPTMPEIEGNNSNTMMKVGLGGALLLTSLAGLGYKLDLIPGLERTKFGADERINTGEEKKDDTPEQSPEEKNVEKQSSEETNITKDSTEKSNDSSPIVNKVSVDAICGTVRKTERSVVPPSTPHDPFGSRVSLEGIKNNPLVVNPKGNTPKNAIEDNEVSREVKNLPSLPRTAVEAANELQSLRVSQSEEDFRKALKLLRTELDECYLEDIDSLSTTELKIRLVQLSSEITQRVRFEAVRSRELMSLKEKEVSQKYLEILQNQRLQFEDVLARRIREQEDEASRNLTKLLQQKDDTIAALLKEATEAQQQSHQEEFNNLENLFKRKYEQTLSAEYQDQLAREKESFAKQLSEITSKMEDALQKVTSLEEFSSFQKTYQSDSTKAHLISAGKVHFFFRNKLLSFSSSLQLH